MKNFVKIEIDSASPDEAEILMAELSENNYYAFEQNENTLAAYIREGDFTEEKLKSILPKDLAYEYSLIQARNWNEEWESQLQPVIINNFAGIRASFHKILQNVKHEIIITPKMSFGTGHHATTFLMVEQMEKINFNNQKVLDFGTGTGVLAILAEKLGAVSVTAVDYDEWSIHNALENVGANHCKYINLEKRDNIAGLSAVNIILANINFNVLTENAKSLSALLLPGSILVISGFLLKDEEAITECFLENNLLKKDRKQKNDWVVVALEKC
jgi:ribosomal protein L11 methyltransferase